MPERKPGSGTILDFGPPWRDLPMRHCCLCDILQRTTHAAIAMQDRSGPGIADFGFKKENNFSKFHHSSAPTIRLRSEAELSSKKGRVDEENDLLGLGW